MGFDKFDDYIHEYQILCVPRNRSRAYVVALAQVMINEIKQLVIQLRSYVEQSLYLFRKVTWFFYQKILSEVRSWGDSG
jgi:hypothetical protein